MLVVVNEAVSGHKATAMSTWPFVLHATCVDIYLMTNRDKYDSFILCERHHVAHGTDLRHVHFRFRSTCILVRIVDS